MTTVRLFGALLILSACGLYGTMAVRRLKSRVTALESLIASLQILSGEICSRLMPMEDVMEILTRETDEPIRSFYAHVQESMGLLGEKSFGEIWGDAARKSLGGCLGESEMKVLLTLGACLGRYDIDEQSAAILQAETRLTLCLRRAEERRLKDGKAQAAFSLAAGLFAVIILL